MEIQACGTKIHYELSGSGSKRVVLLHGWGCDTTLMKPVADFLSQDMTVLSIDFPAHGQSGRPPEAWGVPEYAACTLDVLRQLNFLPCSVIAHSFGGRITLEMASADAALFEKIVLTGGAGLRDKPTEAGKKRAAEYQRLKRLVQAAKNMRIFGSLPDKMMEKLRRKYGSKEYNALDDMMRQVFVKVVNHDQAALLPKIKQPTLLIWGDQDTATPLWMGQQMERDIPDAGLVVFEGGSHFAFLEQIQRFNQIIHVFLMEA